MDEDGLLWRIYLGFGGGHNLLIRILVQTDELDLLHRLMSSWPSVQKPGPALQRGALWDTRRMIRGS